MKSFDALLKAGAAALVFLSLSARADAQFQRVVLLEEYTSVTCVPCATAGRNLNDILAGSPPNIVSIRYHTNFFPVPEDRFFEANKEENAARKAFYDWSAMPRVRIGGSVEEPGTVRSELDARISDELANDAVVKLEVTQVAEGIDRIVTVKATAGPDGLTAGSRITVAAVERLVHDPTFGNSPYNGETDVYDIMRDLLPNAGGEALTLAANEVRNFVYSYQIGEGWQGDQMYAVAFIQDEFDKSIVQAGFSERPVSSVELQSAPGYSASSAVPNPTSNSFRIEYDLGRPGPLAVKLYDVNGVIVRSVDAGLRDANRSSVTVDASGLPAGVYTCVLSSGVWRWSDRVIIAH